MTLRGAVFATKIGSFKASAGRFRRELLANERLSSDALSDLQNRLASNIVRFAMDNSPYYAKTYRRLAVDPAKLSDREEWAKIPILDRATIKANSDRLPTADAVGRNARPALTGGSTGEPLRTLHDARIPTLALAWRMYSWWGVDPYDDLARIGRWSFGRLASIKNDISWWPTKQIYLDAALISNETMTQFHRRVTATRPRLIEGYVGAMLEFADFLERRKLSIPAPKAIATTAAPLTASARSRLESAFGTPVYDEYRGSEFGWLAGECARQDGLHVFADVRLIEVVDEDGAPVAPGALGDLVITDLRNRVFPLIRYRTGDKGILRGEQCRCGRALPLMEQPQGRTTDLIRLPSGAVLAHRLMGMFGANPEAVRLFQIHQQSDFSITIRVVIGEVADARTYVDRAVASLSDRIANEVPVTVEYVDSLPYTGGKIKYVISDVPD